MLTEDVEFSMPPYAQWFRGVTDVGDFLRREPLSGRRCWRGLAIEVNGQFGFALWVDTGDGFQAESINVLTVAGELVSGMVAFRSPELFAEFGLPEQPPSLTDRGVAESRTTRPD